MPIGGVILINGQLFTASAHNPFVMKNGDATTLVTWSAPCAECGGVFTQVMGKTKWPELRRCDLHRKNGIDQ